VAANIRNHNIPFAVSQERRGLPDGVRRRALPL
jgi:hypothetical protein